MNPVLTMSLARRARDLQTPLEPVKGPRRADGCRRARLPFLTPGLALAAPEARFRGPLPGCPGGRQ